MQIPALFQPMSLGSGFGFFGDDDLSFPTDNIFSPDPTETAFTDSNITGLITSQPDVFDLPLLDSNITVAVVDNSGNVSNQFGKPIISNDQITNIALNNPGQEAEAIAKTLQITSPDWAKQFKSTDDLVKAAYNLFNTSKAVVQGKPIPASIQSPYVYNPNDPNMVRRTTTATQSTLSSTNMLLIGGVALAAFLVLRKK